MNNVIATLLSIMLLVVIPSGFAQVHKYIQEQDNVRHVTAHLLTHLSKKGTLEPSSINTSVDAFLLGEIQEQALLIDRSKLFVQVSRVNGFSDQELTAYDSFLVTVDYPRPAFLAWVDVVPDLHVQLTGTMEPVPEYKEAY